MAVLWSATSISCKKSSKQTASKNTQKHTCTHEHTHVIHTRTYTYEIAHSRALMGRFVSRLAGAPPRHRIISVLSESVVRYPCTPTIYTTHSTLAFSLLSLGHMVQARAATSNDSTAFHVGEFLIGAGNYSYFGASTGWGCQDGWIEEGIPGDPNFWDHPLGKPNGPYEAHSNGAVPWTPPPGKPNSTTYVLYAVHHLSVLFLSFFLSISFQYVLRSILINISNFFFNYVCCYLWGLRSGQRREQAWHGL